MKRCIISLVTVFLGLSIANADESVIAAGKTLNDKNCIACHGSELYTRPDRRVTSRNKLTAQVRLCEQSLKLHWFDEEIESVAEYLNKEFYQFQ
jgi:hypothetical protein